MIVDDLFSNGVQHLLLKNLLYNIFKLGSKPEYKKCVEALIRKYITQSQEFDLINSTNRILLSGEADKVAPPEYIEYLNLLDEIKTKVKADFGM